MLNLFDIIQDLNAIKSTQTLNISEYKQLETKNLYVNVDSIVPNEYSCKYHNHSHQEEFFIILGGSGTLRMNDKTTNIRKGDCISKKTGIENSHQFFNSGTENLIILDIGTKQPFDICHYPDEDVIFIKNGADRTFYKVENIETFNSIP